VLQQQLGDLDRRTIGYVEPGIGEVQQRLPAVRAAFRPASPDSSDSFDLTAASSPATTIV
jgi:hypothetical protein